MAQRITHAQARRLLLALAPLLLVMEIPGAVELWRRPYTGMALRNQVVVSVDADSPAAQAGLTANDVLAEFNGRATPDYSSYRAASFGLRAGDAVALAVVRDSALLSMRMQLVAKPITQRWTDFSASFIGMLFLLLGFVTYLRRSDAMGRLFYAICVTFAFLLMDQPTFPWAGWMRVLEALRNIAGGLLLPAFFLRFFQIFPEGEQENGADRRRGRWVYIPALILAPFHLVLTLSGASESSPLSQGLGVITALLFAIYIVAAIAVFARKIRRADRWVEWNKLRVALLGMCLGILPIVLVTVARQIWPGHPAPMKEAALMMLPLVPASLSLALLRTGTIDIAYLIRQSLVALALSVPLVAGAAAALWLLGPVMEGVGRGVTYLLAVLIVFGLSMSASPARRIAAGSIDRLFYPEQLRLRGDATRLAAGLNQPREPQEFGEFLCVRLRELFRSRSVSLYRLEDDQLKLLHHEGPEDRPTPPDELPAQATLLAASLARKNYMLIEPMLSGPRPIRLDEDSQRILAATDATLLCPLLGGGRPLALLIVGPPQHGEIYGEMDLYHFRLVASQAGSALDNSLLHQEDLARQRLTTEMELAREIQRNLLPSEDISAGQFEISGRMVSSLQVGGDVYDHFRLADGRVVMAVADASGKGVPASLLMSSLRTAVRDTVASHMRPSTAAARLNMQVHGMTSELHFIALFLGFLDPESGLLEYSVAGIDPPLWLRTREGRVERLRRGGPVLGVTTDAAYRDGTIRLVPGDVVAAYTDGMIDEEDADGEPFGEGRLIEALQAGSGGGAKSIVGGLIESIEEFGEGQATDDKTLLILKFRESGVLGTSSAVA